MEERVLAGRYRLTAKLGEGGMGSVWRAEHLMLHTQVAIKLIDIQIAGSREAIGRFQREAQAAAELRSTHIVQILDYGIDDGTPFIAMELLEGEGLAARLARLRKLTPSDTAQILSQVARALGRAHQRGIVHRDLKPDNIFIVREDAEEVVKVLDFGIAKKLEGLSGSSGVKTHTGALLGTPYYMSPEQGLGQPDIDHRTDIWSMGIIAFECIIGSRPFERDTLGALLMAICHEPIPKPSQVGSVPAGFDEWFERAAARDRNARFQTAAEAAAELRIIGRVVSERPSDEVEPNAAAPSTPSLLETASPASVTIPGVTKKKARRLMLFFVVPALFLVVAVGYALWRWSQPQVPAVAVSSAQQLPTMRPTNEPNEPTAAAGPVVAVPATATQSPTKTEASAVGSATASASGVAAPIVPVTTPLPANANAATAITLGARVSARNKGTLPASAAPNKPNPASANSNAYKDME